MLHLRRRQNAEAFPSRFSEWYRAKRFAEGKAKGRAEDIKFLKDRGFDTAGDARSS